jgi:thymidylate synthase ThyX
MQNATFRSDYKFEPLTQAPLEQLLMACNVSFGFKQMHLYINEDGTPTEKAIQLIKGGFKNKHKSPFFTQHLDTFVSVEKIYSRLPSSYEFAGVDSALIDGKFHYTFSLYAALMFYKDDRIGADLRFKLQAGIQKKFTFILPIFEEVQSEQALENEKAGIKELTQEEKDLYAKFTLVRETFQIEIPLFMKNQLIRHIQGFSYTEISRRYTFDGIEFFMPESYVENGLLPKAPEIKRQGRDEGVFMQERKLSHEISYDERIGTEVINSNLSGEHTEDLNFSMESLLNFNHKWFKENIKEGIAPEFARNILPQCTYTTLIVSMTVSCAARICGLRLDYHTQKETRDFAEMIKDYFVKYPEFENLIEISKKL